MDNNNQDVVIGTTATCTAEVEGTQLAADVDFVRLDQYVNDHHELTVRVRHTGAVEAGAEFENTSQYTEMLGKPITLKIRPEGDVVDSSRVLEFVGLVTCVRLSSSVDRINFIYITAHSPTKVLDCIEKTKVWAPGTDCADIIQEILGDHPITPGEFDSAPVTSAGSSLNTEVDSVVQYHETDYAYIRRLAAEHDMFAYYDGQKFNATKASVSDEEELKWRETLGSFSIGLGTGPVKYKGQVWDPKSKEMIRGEADDSSLSAATSSLTGASITASTEIFATTGVSVAPKHASQSCVDGALARAVGSSVGGVVICNGISNVPSLRVGSPLIVSGMADLDGKYWLTSVSHIFDEGGQYHNRFVCTPIEFALPETMTERHRSRFFQAGVVTDNQDPEDLGRIKVRLSWHSQDEESEFLRFLTPDGGEGRGWFALPEVGDEVLVAYERGNPDAPVVLGCLYNSKDVPPEGSSACLESSSVSTKIFRTRLGNEIRFDDSDGKEKITVSQKDGTNTIILNMDGPAITVQSDGDIAIKGSTISIESTTGDISLKSAAAISGDARSDVQLKANGNFKSEGGMNYEAKGGVSYKASGVQSTVEGSAMTTIKGGVVKIN